MDAQSESLQEEINRYAKLSEIILAAAQAEDFEDLIVNSAEKIHTIFHFDRCSLALKNFDSTYYLKPLFDTRSQRSMEQKNNVPCNQGIAGWVIENCLMYLTGDLQQEEQLPVVDEPMEGGSLQSLLSLPLQISGQVIGSITFGAISKEHFKITDLEMAVTFAIHMALAADRWQQAERLKKVQNLHKPIKSVLDHSSALTNTGNAQLDQHLQQIREYSREILQLISEL